MSLLDTLRDLAGKIDGQFLPNSQEVGPLLGALIAHLEHGKKLDEAAESDDPAAVTELLQPEPAEATAGMSDQELAAVVSDLQAQQASREATKKKTVSEHEKGGKG